MKPSQLNDLRKRICALDGGEHGNFIDGPIDWDAYAKAQSRILWVLKEAVGDYDATEYNLRLIQDNIEERKFCRTLEMISYVSCAILDGIAQWELVPLLYSGAAESLKQIAIINVKKSMGETSSSSATINRAFSENKKLILDQIAVFDPKVIIMGFPDACAGVVRSLVEDGGYNFDVRKIVGECTCWTQNRRSYIWAYHPSRPGSMKSYWCDIISALRLAQ